MSNLSSVQALYEAFSKKDIFTILRLVDGDFVVTQSPDLPWGGEFHGLGGLKNFFDRLTSHLHSEVKVEEYIEAGSQVVAIGWTRGYVKKNNQPFDIRVVHVWTLRDGKALRFEPYLNTGEMARLLAG